MKIQFVILTFIFTGLFVSCSKNKKVAEEEIRLQSDSAANPDTASSNTLDGSLSLAQLATYPHRVITTGMPDQRMITIYRKISDQKKNLIERSYDSYYSNEYESENETHFMPGIDLLFGYNLVNVAHYNFKTEKTRLLFDHPVLVRSLYYPAFIQDSIDNKPVNRNYFFVSVYNEDTNGDTLINKSDLRRFLYFNADASEQLSLLPADYAVVRSQYDAMRDVMYLFARHDANKNGKSESGEPLHVFWISLGRPDVGKRMY
jgi:hypothetical protein